MSMRLMGTIEQQCFLLPVESLCIADGLLSKFLLFSSSGFIFTVFTLILTLYEATQTMCDRIVIINTKKIQVLELPMYTTLYSAPHFFSSVKLQRSKYRKDKHE